jgi:hypothetical protein
VPPGAIGGMIGVRMETRTHRPRNSLLAASAAAALLLAGCAEMPVADGVDAAAAFARMKTIAGSYPMPASAAAEASAGDDKITYEVTSGGHALLEKMHDGRPDAMTSMYFLEGRDLVLVHYCAIGNRPHLRLDRMASTIDDLRFVWDGTATDIDPAKDGHIHEARMRFTEAGIESEWVFWSGGKEAHRLAYTLPRKATAAAPPPAE